MQFTTKFAFLAAAVTGALAVPLAPRNVEYEIDTREVADLSAREFYEMYLQTRADSALDARALGAMDLEAREYLEYLEARDAAAAPEQKPLGNAPPPANTPDHTGAPAETNPKADAVHPAAGASEKGAAGPKPAHELLDPTHKLAKDPSHPDQFLFKPTPKEKAALATPEAIAAALADPKSPLHSAATYLHYKEEATTSLKESPELFKAALADKTNNLHRLALKMEFTDKAKLTAALEDKTSPLHKEAKVFAHHQEATKYFENPADYAKALSHKKNKYHKEAVRRYLNNREHFEEALHNKKSKYHKRAVSRVLLADPASYKAALADETNPYHKIAESIHRRKKLHKKLQLAKEAVNPSSTPPATPPSDAPGTGAGAAGAPPHVDAAAGAAAPPEKAASPPPSTSSKLVRRRL